MKYEVILQPPAEAEIEAAYLYLAEQVSLEFAIEWFNQLEEQLATLADMPRRCPIAPEDRFFAVEIRHLLMKPYRVLFTVAGKRVHVLHVRHMARRTLGSLDQ